MNKQAATVETTLQDRYVILTMHIATYTHFQLFMSSVFLRPVRTALVAQWREKQAHTITEKASGWIDYKVNRFFLLFLFLHTRVEYK